LILDGWFFLSAIRGLALHATALTILPVELGCQKFKYFVNG